MKNLFYLLFAFSFFFLSCEEETDDPFNQTSSSPSFSCKIGGVQLSDSAPFANIITTNLVLNGGLEISATSNLPGARVMNTVTITIGSAQNTFKDNFLTDIDYILGSSNSGHVWQGADIHSTEIHTYTGTVSFSKITANKVSGTFEFDARDQSTSAIVEVIDGSFSNVSY